MLALGSLAVVPFIITKVRVIEHKPPLQGPSAAAHPRAALEAPVLQEVGEEGGQCHGHLYVLDIPLLSMQQVSHIHWRVRPDGAAT